MTMSMNSSDNKTENYMEQQSLELRIGKRTEENDAETVGEHGKNRAFNKVPTKMTSALDKVEESGVNYEVLTLNKEQIQKIEATLHWREIHFFGSKDAIQFKFKDLTNAIHEDLRQWLYWKYDVKTVKAIAQSDFDAVLGEIKNLGNYDIQYCWNPSSEVQAMIDAACAHPEGWAQHRDVKAWDTKTIGSLYELSLLLNKHPQLLQRLEKLVEVDDISEAK